MKILKCVMFVIVFSTCAKAENLVPSLSLKPLNSESNKGVIEVRPIESGRLGVVKISEFANTDDRYFIVKSKKRSGSNFKLVSVDTNEAVVIKSSRKTLEKGSLVDTFEVFISQSKRLKALAITKSNKGVVENYRAWEIPKKVDFVRLVNSFKSTCSSQTKVQWAKGLDQKRKSRSSHFFKVLISLCKSDSDYKEAISELKFIKVTGGQEEFPSLSGLPVGLSLMIGQGDYILERFTREWLLENL